MTLVFDTTGIVWKEFTDLLDSSYFRNNDIAVFQNNSYFGQEFKTAPYRSKVVWLVYGRDYF